MGPELTYLLDGRLLPKKEYSCIGAQIVSSITLYCISIISKFHDILLHPTFEPFFFMLIAQRDDNNLLYMQHIEGDMVTCGLTLF
jgi:hypothetical protein